MACLRGVHGNRRKDGNCDSYHKKEFYIPIRANYGFPGDYIPVHRFLDEYQKLHPQRPAESIKVSLGAPQ